MDPQPSTVWLWFWSGGEGLLQEHLLHSHEVCQEYLLGLVYRVEANDCPPVASNWEGLGDVTMVCEAAGKKVTTRELTNKGQLTMEII